MSTNKGLREAKITREIALFECHPLVIINEIADACMQYVADDLDELEKALIEETAVKEKYRKLFSQGVDAMFTRLTQALNDQLISFEEQSLSQVFSVTRTLSVDTISQAVESQLVHASKSEKSGESKTPLSIKPISKVHKRLQMLGMSANETQPTGTYSNADALELSEQARLDAEDEALDAELAHLTRKIASKTSYRTRLQTILIKAQANIDAFEHFLSLPQAQPVFPSLVSLIASSRRGSGTNATVAPSDASNLAQNQASGAFSMSSSRLGSAGHNFVLHPSQATFGKYSANQLTSIGSKSGVLTDSSSSGNDGAFTYPSLQGIITYMKSLSQTTKDLEHSVVIAGPALFLNPDSRGRSITENDDHPILRDSGTTDNKDEKDDRNGKESKDIDKDAARTSARHLLLVHATAQKKYTALVKNSAPFGAYFDPGDLGRETNDRLLASQKLLAVKNILNSDVSDSISRTVGGIGAGVDASVALSRPGGAGTTITNSVPAIQFISTYSASMSQDSIPFESIKKGNSQDDKDRFANDANVDSPAASTLASIIPNTLLPSSRKITTRRSRTLTVNELENVKRVCFGTNLSTRDIVSITALFSNTIAPSLPTFSHPSNREDFSMEKSTGFNFGRTPQQRMRPGNQR